MFLKVFSVLFLCLFLASCKEQSVREAIPQTPQPSQVPKPKDVSSAPEKPIVLPESVTLRGVEVEGNAKNLTMGNAAGEYRLTCNVKAMGCETPAHGANYFLFDKRTYWRLPGAKSYIDLDFIQNWTVAYTETQNVGLVPEGKQSGFHLGIYMLESWKPTEK